MFTKDKLDLDTVTASIVNALPKLDLFEQRLSIELYRLLALGQPVPRVLLAARLGVEVETIKAYLEHWPGVFLDSQQQIVGYWGLSLPAAYDSPHKMTVDGQTLPAWCAWDTLFLPQLLAKKAAVESHSPSSGAAIHLTVTPERIERMSPADAQISLLLPDAVAVQKDILGSFCCFVHFFPTPETGESWAAQHNGIFLLSIEEGFAVARKKNIAQYGDILR
uniref:Alkylmercury lyase (Organomercurial lyase) n=1 Tax=mine drainage metagenome TaxID=410659 RepID=E6PXT6_9ZZZZ